MDNTTTIEQRNGALIQSGAPNAPGAADVALAAAIGTADELVKQIEDIGSIDKIAADIAKHARQYMDGYELAKELDNYECWDCNFEIAEILDGHSSRMLNEVRESRKKWVAEWGVKPAFEEGTRVVLSGEEYVIFGVCAYDAGAYKLRKDGMAENSYVIGRFEKCQLADAMLRAREQGEG